MFKDAFDSLINLHHRKMTLSRLSPAQTLEVQATPSNYSRNLAGPSEIVIEGREFIISKQSIKAPFTSLRRGDRLIDPEMGTMTIAEINEMFDLGGSILGWRVRTD